MAKKPRKTDLPEALDKPESKPDRRRNEVRVEPKIKFSTWFACRVHEDPRVKPHHSDALRAYLKGQGLSDQEPQWRYDAALRAYFGM